MLLLKPKPHLMFGPSPFIKHGVIPVQKDINNFLRMGYYLDYKNELLIRPKRIIIARDQRERLEQVDNILESIFSHIFSKRALDRVAIPLSGGFDSRLILSYMLRFKEARDIKTYTFGTPSTYDYEIGNMIAEIVGTNHFNIDMSSLKMSIDDVTYNSEKLNNQCMVIYSTPFHIIDSHFGRDLHYISGFMGDPIAGSKIKETYSLEEAKSKFISDNSITSFNIPYVNSLIDLPKTDLTMYENIDFHNRQSKYIKPHVTPNNNYISPFIEKDFVNFMFSLPTIERKDCKFYRELCEYSNKSLFNLPLKDFHGLSKNTPKSRIFRKKLLNHGLYRLNQIYNFDYIDKRTNYFNIRRKLYTDKSFFQSFNELFQLGAKEIASLNLLSFSESMQMLKHSKNDNDLVIVASIGAQVISGKSW